MLILIHEVGHYIFARIFDVEIKEFSCGMGPKIISKTSKKTNIKYSLRLFPIGGFLSMTGEDEASDKPRALCNKPVWQRMIITAAGALMNIILGVILVTCMVLSSQSLGSTTIAKFRDNSISSQSGLQIGDTIISVDGAKTHTWSSLVYEIGHSSGVPVDIEVLRDNEKVTISNVDFGEEVSSGFTFGKIDFYVNSEPKNFPNVVKHSFYSSTLSVKMIWESLCDLITGKYGVEALSGPVGVTTTIGDAAKSGQTNFLYVCSLIAMNLGIFNLLPLPALDGGRILFMIIELIRGKRIDPKYEGTIHFVGLAILMLFMIFITCKDLLGLIR